MSSTGQIVGTVVGAVIGAFIPGGYIVLGASIGGLVGGAIDPPKGPKIEGPRLSDLSVQTASYGVAIPRVYGTTAVFGNVFWVENNALKETVATESQGGKGGGGGAETTTYTYSATFALGLCQGPIESVKRIWVSGKLIYDAASPSFSGIIASAENSIGIRFYLGTDTQMPDPRMQAALGAANVPAYRGLAYLVFEDFQLADYGNSLMGAQIKVEVVTDSTVTQVYELIGNVAAPITAGTFYNRGVWYDGTTCYQMYSRNSEKYAEIWALRDNVNSELVFAGDIEPYQPYAYTPSWALRSGRSYTPVFAYMYNHVPSSTYKIDFINPNGQTVNTVPWFPLSVNIAGLADNGQAYACESTNFYIWTGGSLSTSFSWHDVYDVAFDDDNFYLTANTASSYLIKLRVVNRVNFTYADFSVVTTTNEACPQVCCSDGVVYIASAHKIYKFDGSTINEYCEGWPVDSHSTLSSQYFLKIGDVFFSASRLNNSPGQPTRSAIEVLYPRVQSNTVTLGSVVSKESISSNLLTLSDIDTSLLTSSVRGFSVAQTAAIRSAIEPLRSAWPFDVIQDRYKIAFLPRGRSSVATIDISELGSVAGGEKPAIRITNSREMDSQIPRRVEVSYLDVNREYDQGAGPGAERLNTSAINITKVELAIVLNADEAAQVEEKLLYLYWLERNDISFVLPPTYARIQPADVVTISGDSATYEVRLTDVNILPDGRIECQGKYNNAAVYTSVAVGEEGAVTGQVLTQTGSTELDLLDIPCVDSSHMNRVGILFGMSGYFDGWPGGSVFSTPASSQDWRLMAVAAKPGITNGRTTNALASGITHMIDVTNTLNVSLTYGSLSSVTEISMFNGANHFAVGAHGRWEIIAAQNVVAEVNGTFTLSNLMRGRFGTEWAMTTHAVFDSVVLLDISPLGFINQTVSEINMTKYWRGVTNGKTLDSAENISLTYTGVNLKCLSPVYASSYHNAVTGDRVFNWVPRSRTPVEPFSGIATPVGETTESYELEIWTSGHTTLKRTLTGLTSPTATYTSANQTTDFGSPQTSYAVKIYQLSPTAGRGYPLISTLTTSLT